MAGTACREASVLAGVISIATRDCGCGAGAEPAVRIIEVAGMRIGVNRVATIIQTVRARGFLDEASIKNELLRLAKTCNYVPTGLEPAYREALWREYLKVK